ncbi:WXG100 family type VII secretion target [Streptomyces sp. NPDC048639]|uniref:WXG100 family type VII secretion target n=1 Tax=Streptomyces sp. NPDC048639 TaxID=3365581 RepID=UPI00371646E7
MSDALERIGFSVDWSNPLAGALDSVIREAVKELGLDEKLETVSGDNELLLKVAGHWRTAARDMRGVVDDLVAERRTLQTAWAGDASTAFGEMMADFEKAMIGEADDMDTVAELLEAAAEACAMAEEAMIELIVEIVETLLVAAATAAIVALLTAGVGAAVGPLIAAAGTAHRVLKAVRITAKLADKLADLARRMQALRKLAKLRRVARRTWQTRKDGTILNPSDFAKLKRGIKQGVKAAVGAQLVDAAIGAAPTAGSVAEHYGVDTQPVRDAMGTAGDFANRVTDGAERQINETTGLDQVRVGDGQWDLTTQEPRPIPEAPATTEESRQYANRPDSQRFDGRLVDSAPNAARSVREAFG